jgi:hypothetical protein
MEPHNNLACKANDKYLTWHQISKIIFLIIFGLCRFSSLPQIDQTNALHQNQSQLFVTQLNLFFFNKNNLIYQKRRQRKQRQKKMERNTEILAKNIVTIKREMIIGNLKWLFQL